MAGNTQKCILQHIMLIAGQPHNVKVSSHPVSGMVVAVLAQRHPSIGAGPCSPVQWHPMEQDWEGVGGLRCYL